MTFPLGSPMDMIKIHTNDIQVVRQAAAAKWLQSCPTLSHPIDSLLPGSSDPGILHARTLEWVAISFSTRNIWPVIKLSALVIKGLVAPFPEPGPEFFPTSVLSKSRTNQGP